MSEEKCPVCGKTHTFKELAQMIMDKLDRLEHAAIVNRFPKPTKKGEPIVFRRYPKFSKGYV